jgi:ribosomal protein S18 acetylase RimI-like enzyme
MADSLIKVASFVPVNKSTIGLLKVIHQKVLPVNYCEAIYDVIKDGIGAHGELLYLYDDTAVGEICWRIEEVDGLKKLYIMTIGVLPVYQKKGLGKYLLEHAISEAQKRGVIIEVYLHVHEENRGGQEFYERLGFHRGQIEIGYYTSLENGNAIVFSKTLTST